MANPSFDHDQMRAECQRYLTSFRVLELKELLKTHGQSTKGRKPELFQRANELLRLGSPKLQSKIREIYEKANGTRRQLNYNRAAQKNSPAKSGNLVVKNPSRPYIVHPDVRFKAHPFFSKLETIIRPTALMTAGVSTHSSLHMKLKFHLTPQQIHLIYVSKTSTGTYQTQVLVRFCLQETTSDQNDFYPKQCYVKVNGHNCPIPGYHPHLSTRSDYKRTGQPVNITNSVKTNPADSNEVIVYWAHDIMVPQGYCVGIEISEVLSSSDLLQALKAKGVRSPDMSRALVKDKFTMDKDSEVAATSMKVSLLCPIGKMRMSYPCRSTHCSHLQCFDASIYYQMNEKRARWVCPVCDKAALPGDLFIDGLFMEICQNSPSSNSIIEFLADGSWQPASEASSSSLTVDTPDKRGNSPITIDNTECGGKKSDIVVIDLTTSSDEEEEEDASGEKAEEMEGREEREREGDNDKEEGELEDEEEEVDVEEGTPHHNQQTTSQAADDATASDSESTISSHSSSTIAAPNSPSRTQSHINTFPHLSFPISSVPSAFPITPYIALPSSEQPAIHSLPSELSVTIPTSSISLRCSSSSESQTVPSASSTSASQPTSVIMHSRQHSNARQHFHFHSHSHSHSHCSHPRIRKHSRSSSHSSHPHSSHSHSSHSHSSRPHSSHSHSHKHTHPSSSSFYSRSSSGTSRGESASVPSRGAGRPAPYPPLHSNGYPTPGEALLTSNILSFDETVLNMLRATYFQSSSHGAHQNRHTDTDD